MRLFVHNPHNFNLIGTPVSYRLIGKKPMPKYWYLLDRKVIEGRDIFFFIDATSSSLLPDIRFAKLPFVLRFAITWIEALGWALINNVPIGRLRFRGLTIRPDDVLLSFVYRDFRGHFDGRAAIMAKFGAILAHLSHYCIDLASISTNAARLKDRLWFVAEAPLHENCPIFQSGFAWYERPVLVVPFVPQPRFQQRKPIVERQSRAVSTGSFHILSEEPESAVWTAFREVSGLDTVHPFRQELNHRKAEVREEIEVMNSRFWETPPKPTNPPRGFFGPIVAWFRSRRAKAAPQSRYLSLDIVDLYNDYQMSLIGEEATGLPGVGMAESMACGCVYLGRRDPMYEALGMIEGVHYLAYDGGVEDLRAVVRDARAQSARLEAISGAALDLVRSGWSKTAVIDCLIGLASGSVRS